MTSLRAKDAAELYRVAALEGAAPIVIVRRLYEGALRFVDAAIATRPAEQPFVEHICRARDIVTELRLALDRDIQGAPSAELASLYVFCERRLSDALGERDVKPLDDVRRVLTALHGAWRVLAERKVA